ncbi:MAG: hypothetical protein HY738_20640 [Bacteroidia bacterium]|nr:hypothetical protein [Bacteroidia bacterium]
MKFLIIILTIIIAVPTTYPQSRKINKSRIDFGPFGGAAYYYGEINLSRPFYSPMPAGGIIARWPLNTRYAVKGDLITALLQLNDNDFSSSYKIERGRSVSTYIIELAVMAEFNYLPYIEGSEDNYYTPYVTAGAACFYFSDAPFPVQPAIPFGAGFKYSVSELLNISVDWTFRRTFTDRLDNLSGVGEETLHYKQIAFFYNKDWYSIAGIGVTFKIPLKEPRCMLIN